MNHIYFGLLCEGSTDRAALPPLIDKVIAHLRATEANASSFEWNIGLAGKSSNDEVREAAKSGNYDILLVHRDGANAPNDYRLGILQIEASAIPIIPVYEIEAWLIVDSEAFRKVTNTSNQRVLPPIPTPNQIESIDDPKSVAKQLFNCCLGYTLSPRTDDIESWYSLVAGEVNFELLRQLHQFDNFITDLKNGLLKLGWPFGN